MGDIHLIIPDSRSLTIIPDSRSLTIIPDSRSLTITSAGTPGPANDMQWLPEQEIRRLKERMAVLEKVMEQLKAAIPDSQERSYNMVSSIAGTPCPASRFTGDGRLPRSSSIAPQHDWHAMPSSSTFQGDITDG
ncbi:unnamed protein product [Zymoseptoria tritici ST99CH_1E4]|uniref:Uncharacterized protein n=1 Tax=Zymoseptoria tritici ST99CH_1E4 TaxID=1276532 RepID=A0A2H1H947_ZYMTR|nr:unnamed protein product [Zymoseptoria tritici ST99CH_1E4]